MKYKTVLIGFGKIAAGLSRDQKNASWFSYATHAQVLKDHPSYDWVAVVDPDINALALASSSWGIANVAQNLESLTNASEIEVAIIATPPKVRLNFIQHLPSLIGVFVEKPLGVNLEDAKRFVTYCNKRKIIGAVNYPRRFDTSLIELADHFKKSLEIPKAIFGVYGNGLINNGSHLINLIEMMFGPPASIFPITRGAKFTESPIKGDINIPFNMFWNNGLIASIQPISFSHYREVSLDVWENFRRVQILNESLTIIETPLTENRQLMDSHELSYELSNIRYTELGKSLYLGYSNLALAIEGKEQLFSSLEDGLETMRLIDQIHKT